MGNVTPDADFMDDLVSGLDESFFNAAPSSSPSPQNNNTVANDVDIIGLTDGAENWNWDDMESDILTPTKSRTAGQASQDIKVSSLVVMTSNGLTVTVR